MVSETGKVPVHHWVRGNGLGYRHLLSGFTHTAHLDRESASGVRAGLLNGSQKIGRIGPVWRQWSVY